MYPPRWELSAGPPPQSTFEVGANVHRQGKLNPVLAVSIADQSMRRNIDGLTH